MNTSATTKGERALERALKEIGGIERTAVILLFFAAARRMGKTFDAATAGELAYMMADELTTGVRK